MVCLKDLAGIDLVHVFLVVHPYQFILVVPKGAVHGIIEKCVITLEIHFIVTLFDTLEY
jgi:hypothetical protein